MSQRADMDCERDVDVKHSCLCCRHQQGSYTQLGRRWRSRSQGCSLPQPGTHNSSLSILQTVQAELQAAKPSGWHMQPVHTSLSSNS